MTLATRQLCVFLLIIFSLPLVHAIGISPPSMEVMFQPSLEADGELTLLAMGNSFGAKISVQGELEKYITTDQSFVNVPPEGMNLSYHIRVPESMRPGNFNTSIGAEQSAVQQSSGPGKAPFGAVSAIGMPIYIIVPAQDKYAEISMDSPGNVELGKSINFHIQVINYGNQSLSPIKGKVHILTSQNKSLATIDTDAISLNVGEHGELYAYWVPANITAGFYQAYAEVEYAEKKVKTPTYSFLVGDIFIDVLDLEPHQFQPDHINKFNISIRSFWSQPLENVFAQIDIVDRSGAQKDSISTPPITLPAWQPGELTSFWDTANYNESEYTAKVTLNYYNGKTTTKEFKVMRAPDTIAPSGGSFGLGMALFIIVGIIVLAVILIYIWHRKQLEV